MQFAETIQVDVAFHEHVEAEHWLTKFNNLTTSQENATVQISEHFLHEPKRCFVVILEIVVEVDRCMVELAES